MLGQRVLTAVVLLALLVPALLSSDQRAFLLLTLLLISAAGWEWARLNACTGIGAAGWGVLVAVLCISAWMWNQLAPPHLALAWLMFALAWVMGVARMLHLGVPGWQRLHPVPRRILGVVVLTAAWLGMAQAHALGAAFLLSAMSLVWVADIAAYFGGHRWGRRKLAPTVSPGKTWEGAACGLVAVVLWGGLWFGLEQRGLIAGPSLYGMMFEGYGTGAAVLALAALAALSVMGDLFESLVKRAAGAKDSSRLLPGHGGVLDRIDAMLGVFPAVALIIAWRSNP